MHDELGFNSNDITEDSKTEKKPRALDENQCRVYDLEVDGWRSFNYDSEIEPETMCLQAVRARKGDGVPFGE